MLHALVRTNQEVCPCDVLAYKTGTGWATDMRTPENLAPGSNIKAEWRLDLCGHIRSPCFSPCFLLASHGVDSQHRSKGPWVFKGLCMEDWASQMTTWITGPQLCFHAASFNQDQLTICCSM